jgi:hypothetical protein
VPFMKSTTGAEATARSIAVRTSVLRRRVFDRDCEICGKREAPWEGVDGWRAEMVARRACSGC